MKSKFYIIILLSSMPAVFAQTWTAAGNDSVFIRINVIMEGMSWSLDTLDDGWDNDSDSIPLWHQLTGGAYELFWAETVTADPCAMLLPAYWLENLGGITLDIMVRAQTGPDWIWHPSLFTCADLIAAGISDQIGLAVVAQQAAFGIDDFETTFVGSSCIPLVSGAWDEITINRYSPVGSYAWQRYGRVDATGTNLIGDDNHSPPISDGAYRRDGDIIELYFYVLSAPLPASPYPQTITFWLKAKISD